MKRPKKFSELSLPKMPKSEKYNLIKTEVNSTLF